MTCAQFMCRAYVSLHSNSFHRFRASGASVMDNNRALLPSIQRVFGHADRRHLERLRDVERDAMDVNERESRKEDDKVA